MLLDERLEFADNTELDQSGTDTDNLGDVIDLGVARDIGHGQPLYLVIQVTVAFTSSGSTATIVFQLVSDGTDTIATSGQTIHAKTTLLTIAQLAVGKQYVIPIPSEGLAFERFLALQTVTGTEALTAGKVNAFLTTEPSVVPTTSYADAAN